MRDSLPAACRLFSRGMIFTHARVSLALLSLRKNGGLLVVYGIQTLDILVLNSIRGHKTNSNSRKIFEKNPIRKGKFQSVYVLMI